MEVRRRLVFVVDEDRAVRASLKFALELEELEVCPCASAADLLAHPRLMSAGCIVLSHRLPTMDGFEAVSLLKARRCRAPVIMSTHAITSSVRLRAEKAGVRLIEPPFLDSTLTDAIRSVQ